jgi:outer membrane lipoprotein SlyB
MGLKRLRALILNREIVMKMKTRGLSLLLAITLAVFTAGCASMQGHEGAAVGAGAGAATGAVAGALIGKGAGAVVVGSLLGALAGGAVGHYAYDQKKSREETAKEYNYGDSQGMVLRIESVSISPGEVSPGGEVQLSMTYAVLTPGQARNTSITEIREITHLGQIVGKPQVQVTRPNGTFTSTVPLRLPADAARGSTG